MGQLLREEAALAGFPAPRRGRLLAHALWVWKGPLKCLCLGVPISVRVLVLLDLCFLSRTRSRKAHFSSLEPGHVGHSASAPPIL